MADSEGVEKMRVLVLVALVVSGCSSLNPLGSATEMARDAEMEPLVVPSGDFLVTAFRRIANPEVPSVVYIEGDGLAWKSRSEPSLDPTPHNPIGLKLAAIDRSQNVIYVAKPCQYSWSAKCSDTYWTGKRFSEEVIAAMNHAIDQLKPPGGAVHLVGYSGGAAVALLVAARRSDVASIRTVAGNLDTEAVNRYHHVSPMPKSLNPADESRQLSNIPQQHFVGNRDSIVPPFIAEGYISRSGNGRCEKISRIDAASHEEGWERVWQKMWAVIPVCR